MMHTSVLMSFCTPKVCGVVGVPHSSVRSYRPARQSVSTVSGVGSSSAFRTVTTRTGATEQAQGYVTYEGDKTVFPAEACDELGEEFCGLEGVGEEVKPKTTAGKGTPVASQSETVEREYEEYKGDKTVFPGEACEELGGEFCGPEYQLGVFPEVPAK